MWEVMSRDYYWPNMEKSIKAAVAGCLACKRTKTPAKFGKEQFYGLAPSRPLSVVSLDLFKGFPPDRFGNTHLLVIQDNFSRWCVLVPLGSTGAIGAREVANAVLKHWISKHATPDVIISDKGPQFEAQVWKTLGRAVGFRPEITPSDAHWRVARPERLNRYIKERLSIWKRDNYEHWTDVCPFIEMSHRFLPIPNLHMSPYEVLYGFAPRLPFNTLKSAEAIPDRVLGGRPDPKGKPEATSLAK